MASIWTTWTGSEWLTNANGAMVVLDAETGAEVGCDLTREIFDASAAAGPEGYVLLDEDFVLVDAADVGDVGPVQRVYVGVA